MLEEPTLSKLNCKHYIGFKWFGNEEATENNFCSAFPGGIPQDITYGDVKYLKPLKGQGARTSYLFQPSKVIIVTPIMKLLADCSRLFLPYNER